MTFTIGNTRIEGNTIVVFYQFDNGEVNSNTFPLTSTVVDIMAWGSARAEWFVQREAGLKAMQEALMTEVADGSSDN